MVIMWAARFATNQVATEGAASQGKSEAKTPVSRREIGSLFKARVAKESASGSQDVPVVDMPGRQDAGGIIPGGGVLRRRSDGPPVEAKRPKGSAAVALKVARTPELLEEAQADLDEQ